MKNLFPGLMAAVGLLSLVGCSTPQPTNSSYEEAHQEITLQAGDVVRVTFPGAANLDTQGQPIRRDGKITLPIVGEVPAAGMSPEQLQDKLVSLYAGQLVSKEVVVTVEASKFSVYVDGPVQKPGRVDTDHPLSILEAIEEAGGFDYTKADTRHVQIIRHKGDSPNYTYYTVDVKAELDGSRKDVFYLQPGDIVHVPQKFTIF